ncbi:MAG: hypothetical protein ACD_75C01102G0003 [uncultured bacterium]|nr:MAG: hypothetical protein ACD_75C01102G0003 [uncultured bacterium]
MRKTVYLDYQASTPVDPRVVAKMLPLLQCGYGNPHSSDHIFGWRAADVVEQSRQEVAAVIGADSDEIVFTSGATESNNLALFGSFRRNCTRRRNKLLVSAIEHKCVLEAAFCLARDYDAVFQLIPVDNCGLVDLNLIESELNKDDVLVVSVMSVNNEVGAIQPIKTIGRLAREKGAFFHTDAAQALNAIDIDVYEQNIDLLSLSAHKIYGPQGIGALYVRRELQEQLEPLIYGGGQQLGLRSGTVPAFLTAGFAAAIGALRGEIAAGERESVAKKRDRFVKGIMEGGFPVRVNGPSLAVRHPGNANLLFQDFANHDILSGLQPQVAASTGSACTSGTPEPSYVLRAMGLTHEEASSSIRFSLGRFTTDEEVEIAIEATLQVLAQLR